MSFNSVFVFIVLVLTALALAKDRMRPGMILFSASIVLMCAGILSPRDMLEGFSNKGMITVALLFLVSEGVRRSGMLEKVSKMLLPESSKSTPRVLLRFLPSVAGISAFLNNTPVVVIFAPMLKRWADKKHLPATKYLIPLSYATIMGGMCTLVGTSTNLVVDGMMLDAGYEGFAMFELAKVGGFIALVGIIYLAIFAQWLLPDKRAAEDLEQDAADKHPYHRIEVVLGARFPAIGKRIVDFDFKRKYGATLIEIHRNGRIVLMHDMRRERFREGDTLVVLADNSFMDNWGDSSFFLMVANGSSARSTLPQYKRVVAVVLLFLMIVGATVGELPWVRESFPRVHLDMFFFAAVVVVVMAWMNIFNARKYTKYISWDILITIGSALAISKAMMTSGFAGIIGEWAVDMTDIFRYHSVGPYVLLAMVFVITNVFTELVTNNAAAALMFPISMSIAHHLGVDPFPFFVTVCMAASASFSTPIGYQTNLIVQGVGGYRFKDFMRIGLPLNIIALILTTLLVPIFWPFN